MILQRILNHVLPLFHHLSLFIFLSLTNSKCLTCCNIMKRKSFKLLSAHKRHIRESSLFTGSISNQVHNSQASCFFSRSKLWKVKTRRHHVELWLQSVMPVGVWWCRSSVGIG